VSLQFCSLGSGSRGNALLVESANTLLLIDCGLSRRELEARMQRAGRDPSDISAVLVTHEHADHVQGLGPLRNRYDMPVWMTHGTATALDYDGDYEAVRYGVPIAIGDLAVEPFPVPHDAREPVQFAFASANRRLGVLTDTGHVTAHIVDRLRGCDAIALEFNHDFEMLMSGPYPDVLKTRVGSNFGHLNNAQAAELLRLVAHDALKWVVALHMSEQNNSHDAVGQSIEPLRATTGFGFTLARQGDPSDWHRVD
jgi:phosphoribosyl 1,2-cyclic phosphodiesterase